MEFSSKLFRDDRYTAFLNPKPFPVVGVVGGGEKNLNVRTTIASGIKKLAAEQQPAQPVIMLELDSHDDVALHNDTKPYEGRACLAPLKSSWFKKHQTAHYSTLVVLFDWDNVEIENPNDRIAFQNAVGNKVDSVKNRVRGSVNTCVHLVLCTSMRRGSEFPTAGGFNNIEEAMVVLRHHCNLEQKQIFVVYQSGEDTYSMGMLQKSVMDAALRYHKEEITRIKKLKNDIQRSNNPSYYQARHRYKCGWHSLVLNDQKAAVHNFDKSYNALRAIHHNPALSARICASLTKWSMVHIGIESCIKTIHTDMNVVEPYVQQFLQHMMWIEQPLGKTVNIHPTTQGLLANSITSSPSFSNMSVTSSRATFLGSPMGAQGSPAVGGGGALNSSDSNGDMSLTGSTQLQSNTLRETDDDQIIRRIVLYWLIVDMYKAMGTLLERAFTKNPTVSPSTPTNNPGYHYHCAAKYLSLLREELSFATNMRQETLALAGPEEVANAAKRMLEEPLSSMRFLGFDDALPPVMFDRALAVYSPVDVSNKMNECLLLAQNHFQQAGHQRTCQQLTFSMAQHYFFTKEYPFCFDKVKQLLQRGDLSKWPWLTAQVEELLVRCCRSIMNDTKQATDGSESVFAMRSPTEDLTTQEKEVMPDGAAPASPLSKSNKVVDELLRALLHLSGNPQASLKTQRSVLLETSSFLKQTEHDRPLHLKPLGDVAPLIQATASFGSAYAEAASGKSTTFTVTLETTATTSLQISSIVASMSVIGAAQGPYKIRQAVPLPQYTVYFLQDSKGTKAADQSPQRLNKNSPLVLCTDITFAHAALIACTQLEIILDLPLGGSGDVELSKEFAKLPLLVQLDPSPMYHRFEHRRYDTQIDAVNSQRPHTTHLHRPLIRVVPPVPQVTIDTIQGIHAIEGEDYTIVLRLRSSGDHVDAGMVSIPYITDMLEIVDTSLDEHGNPRDPDAPPLYIPAPFDNPERPYCIHKLTRVLEGEGELYELNISFRCYKAGKFEIPIRLDYATPKCSGMTLHHTVRLHVCHPVFAYFTVADSFWWAHNSSHKALTKMEEATGPHGSLLSVPSQASASLFVESSELRVEEVHHAQHNASFDGLLLQGSFTMDSAAAANALMANSPNPVTMQLYSVQRTQIPSQTHNTMAPLALRCGQPFSITCKFSNSLQCPIDIADAFIAPSEGAPVEILQAVGKTGAGLPCRLDADGDFTMHVTLRYTGPPGPAVCLGSAVLILTRVEEDSPSEAAPIEFQLPLPDAEFVAAPVTIAMEHQSFGQVGKAFPLVCHLTNSSRTQFTEVKVSLMLPISSNTASSGGSVAPGAGNEAKYSVSGRTTVSFSVAPLTSKKTVFKIVPLVPGPLCLPAVTAQCKEQYAATTLARPDDSRSLYIYPADGLAPGSIAKK